MRGVCGVRFPALRRSAKTCSPVCRQRLSRRLRAATPLLPPGPFDLIVADPPWPFATFSDKGRVKTMDGKVLKEGSGPYTCFPTPPEAAGKGGRAPMCLDKVWLAWADAWM